MEFYNFGEAPKVGARGYVMAGTVRSRASVLQAKHMLEDIIFVYGPELNGANGVYEFARFVRPENVVTKVPYLYRDEDNYKASSEVLLAGVLTDEDKALIQAKLDSGEFFIPHDLGLGIQELQSELTDFPGTGDHVWHTLEFDEIEKVPAQLVQGRTIAAKDFVAAFAAVETWDVTSAVERLGI